MNDAERWPNYPPPAEYIQRPEYYVEQVSPIMTWLLIAANLCVFAAMIVFDVVGDARRTGGTVSALEILDFVGQAATTPTLQVLWTFGAKVNELIANGAYWRLLTATFLHAGFVHLFSNLYMLAIMGKLVEGYFGHARFLAIYVVGGLGGSLASFALSEAISVGASGAIFGVAGAIAVYFYFYGEKLGRQGLAILQNTLIVIVVNLVLGFRSANIDNWGHLGGLIGGAIATLGLMPRYETPPYTLPGRIPLLVRPRLWAELGWVLVCFGLVAVGVYWVSNY